MLGLHETHKKGNIGIWGINACHTPNNFLFSDVYEWESENVKGQGCLDLDHKAFCQTSASMGYWTV